MFRLLPILLLTLGLVFAFASLARAEAAQAAVETGGLVCIDIDEAEWVAPEPVQKSVVCWKKIRTGLVTTPCPPDPSLIAAGAVMSPPAPNYPCRDGGTLGVSEAEPVLPLPPPRG